MTDTPIRSFTGEFAFLSNFFPSDVWPSWWPRTLPPFPTVEHAFAACKTDTELSFPERLTAIEGIRSAGTPGQAKRLGRKVGLRGDWGRIRADVMLLLLRLKFSDFEFDSLLKSTNSRPLVEGNNWHDQFWGDCGCPTHAATPGENTLGKLLMQVREERRTL